MTPTKIRTIRTRLGLTQRQFAKRLGVHEVTVRKWETGMQVIRNTHAMLIRLIAAQTAGNRKGARKSTRARRR